MKKLKSQQSILALTPVTVLVLVISASFSLAKAAETYHGIVTGGTFFCNRDQASGPTVTGTWNLNIDAQTPAQLTLNVFYDGRHHLSFGNNDLILVSFVGGVYMFSGFGGIATATLDTSVTPAAFSWHVELGVSCPSENPYNSLTFSGLANRGGE